MQQIEIYIFAKHLNIYPMTLTKKILSILFFSLSATSVLSQEIKTDTIQSGLIRPDLPLLPEQESVKAPLQLKDTEFYFELENKMLEDVELMKAGMNENFGLDKLEPAEDNFLVPPRFQPSLDFTFSASRFAYPVFGDVITFSPGVQYLFTENLAVYGGVNFSQIPNLSFVQNIINPMLPAGSNILINGYLGVNYSIWDRIILRADYQRSFFNQLPENLKPVFPGQNILSTGVSLDVWKGLGVTVEHVWEYDGNGRMRKGMRYSPYVDVNKFVKFLSGE